MEACKRVHKIISICLCVEFLLRVKAEGTIGFMKKWIRNVRIKISLLSCVYGGNGDESNNRVFTMN
jgi:hypothetical protein